MNSDHYTYRVTWSPEAGEHVGLCIEFPSLAWLDKTPEDALRGIRNVVKDVVADMRANGELIPKPTIPCPHCGLPMRHEIWDKEILDSEACVPHVSGHRCHACGEAIFDGQSYDRVVAASDSMVRNKRFLRYRAEALAQQIADARRTAYEADDGLLSPDELDAVRAAAAADLPTGKVHSVKSLLHRPDQKPVSIDEMNAAVRHRAADLNAQCDPEAPLPEDLREWEQMPDVELERLADKAKAGAERADAALDAALKFCDESNERIERMK